MILGEGGVEREVSDLVLVVGAAGSPGFAVIGCQGRRSRDPGAAVKMRCDSFKSYFFFLFKKTPKKNKNKTLRSCDQNDG